MGQPKYNCKYFENCGSDLNCKRCTGFQPKENKMKMYTLFFKPKVAKNRDSYGVLIHGIGKNKREAFKSIQANAFGIGIQPHWLSIKDVKVSIK